MKLSVAICTYNGSEYLKTQIDSILNQTVAVDEIIICDDRSTDETLEILKRYSATNPSIFKVFQNEIGLGAKKNFERAISLCSGDIIFLSDQDDIWKSGKVAAVTNHLDRNPQLQMVFTDGDLINGDGVGMEGTLFSSFAFDSGNVDDNFNEKMFRGILSGNNFVTGATVAIKKSLFQEASPFDLPKRFWHDGWLALIASYNKKLGFLNQQLISYRLHDKQQVGVGKSLYCMTLKEILERMLQKDDDAIVLIDKMSAFDPYYFHKLKKEKIAHRNFIVHRLSMNSYSSFMRLFTSSKIIKNYFSHGNGWRDYLRDIVKPA